MSIVTPVETGVRETGAGCAIGGTIVGTVDDLTAAPGVARQIDLANLAAEAQLFRALGDETRLSIVRQLRQCQEVCACDFVAGCALAQPTISHHLKVLREAGIVETTKRGLWVYYRLNPNALESLRRYTR
ncbi:MAG: transcriptional regulator [Chloroflexota bacterium]|nr:MAG: transcriptional regulator [Chloroflexota bacterium]